MHRRKFRFWRFLLFFLAFWSGLLVVHFLWEIISSAMAAMIADAMRAFTLVTRPGEVIVVGAISLGIALLLIAISLIASKREDRDRYEDDQEDDEPLDE